MKPTLFAFSLAVFTLTACGPELAGAFNGGPSVAGGCARDAVCAMRPPTVPTGEEPAPTADAGVAAAPDAGVAPGGRDAGRSAFDAGSAVAVVDAGRPSIDAGVRDAGVPTNIAQVVWEAVDGRARGTDAAHALRESYGKWAIDWLRIAKNAAASTANITTGTLTESSSAPGAFSYSPGGTSLRVVRSDGGTFELRVTTLRGAVSVSNFPSGNDALVASYYWAVEGWTLAMNIANKDFTFSGTAYDPDDSSTDILDVTNVHEDTTTSVSTYNGMVAGYTDGRYSGRIRRSSATGALISDVTYATTMSGGLCGGTGCFGPQHSYEFDNDVTLTLPGRAPFHLVYTTGHFLPQNGVLEQRYWAGDVFQSGHNVGALVETQLPNIHAVADDITVSGATYRVRVVAQP